MSKDQFPAVFVFGAFLVALLVYLFSSKSRRLPLPPGPKTSWLGSVELPRSYQWLTYAKWKETYGDVIYYYTFGNPILVLNSAEATDELLEKRGGNYSSRPLRPMMRELMGWGWLFSTMPYGPWWRRHRKLFHKYFNINITSIYHPGQIKETHTLLRSLLVNPDDFDDHTKRAAAAIIVKIVYGHIVAEKGDSYVALADAALEGIVQAGIFGSFLVDYIPILKYVPAWMPGASFKRKARKWRLQPQALLERPFETVKQKMVDGTAMPCVATWELENWMESGQDPAEEELIKNTVAIAYTAGADTIVAVIASFFLTMVIHPEIQKKAQEELDRVIGKRLPDFSDKESLPYISCIAWECLRWNPVTPFGVAHFVTEDDKYNGYRIPKGTTVLPNVWAILHDEKTYPEPLRFYPERFENEEKNALAGINKHPWPAFGFGRRICPGRWLAYDNIWIAIASVLSVYNISPAIDENGTPIQPSAEYTPGLISRPKPFKCSIVPRSEFAVTLIKQTADEQ